MAKKLTLMCNGKKLIITPQPGITGGEPLQGDLKLHAPGQGSYEIANPDLASGVIVVGEKIAGKTIIKGKNISQIFIELMLQVGDFKVGPIQNDFLQSPKKHEVKGVLHPQWEAENEISFEIQPFASLLYCGEGFTLACLSPERYGVEQNAQIWRIEGIYQRGGGEPFRVRFEFDSLGSLVRKTGFSPESVGGVFSPFELLIEDGDTFEPYVNLINEKGNLSLGTVNPIMLGGGNQLHWEKIQVCTGDYFVGVAVTDFDGLTSHALAPLKIVEP